MTEAAAAVIWRGNKFLICQRPREKRRGLLWEFPGGEIAPGETAEACLVRAVRESLGVTPRLCGEFYDTVRKGSGGVARLRFFRAELVSGEPAMRESGAAAWVTQAETEGRAFRPADARMLRENVLSPDPDAVLETERLLLRPWSASDAEACFPYTSDPRIGPAAGWPAHTSVEECRGIILDVLAVPETYAVVWKESGALVGCIALKIGKATHLTERADECELGYWVGAPWWGRGIMPEAVRALLRRAFETLGFQKVWCAYYDGNGKSKRVQEKCGFRFERTVEDMDVPLLREKRRCHVNALTREDWLAGLPTQK